MRMYAMKDVVGFALVAMLLATPALARDDRPLNERIAADADGEVIVSNVSGSVRVEGWARNEVEVTGSIDEDVERVEVARDGKRVTVKVVLPKGSSNDSDADLTIRVPAASRLEVTSVSADGTVRGVTGALRLKSVSGEIEARGVASDSDFKTVSGDIRVAAAATPVKLRATSVSGTIIVDDVSGEIEALTVSGEMLLDLDAITYARARTTSGDSRVSGQLAKDARVEFESVSGDVILKLGAEAGFAASAESFSGELSNCFGVKPEAVSKYGPGERMSLTRGEGSARVRIQTMSGDVRICDR